MPQKPGFGTPGIAVAAEPVVMVIARDQEPLFGERPRNGARNELEAVAQAGIGVGRAGVAEDPGAGRPLSLRPG